MDESGASSYGADTVTESFVKRAFNKHAVPRIRIRRKTTSNRQSQGIHPKFTDGNGVSEQ
jgi:hypothetical protein